MKHVIALSIMLFAGGFLTADEYRLPPQEIVDLIDAPPPPAVDFSPDYQWLLLLDRDAMPSIENLSRRMLRLAGLRIDPVANGPFRVDFDRGLRLRRRDSDQEFRIPLPDRARIASARWAHDSKSTAYTVVTDAGTELWVVSVSDIEHPRRLTDRLMWVLQGFAWMPDGQAILCVLTPEDRGPEPAPPAVPPGPNVEETVGDMSPTRTFQDLLSNASDETLFEHYATGQLAVLSLDGRQEIVGEPAMILDADPAPDGQHLLVTTVHRPFSYLLPVWSFPQRMEVWDRQGRVVSRVADVPLEENVPIEGVRLGPRQLTWVPSERATLMWTEALDGGDPRHEVDHRDRWLRQSSPFTEQPQEVARVEHRAWGVSFLAEPGSFMTTEYDRDRRWVRVLLRHLQPAPTEPKILADRSIRDRYGDPGRVVLVPNAAGKFVALQHGRWIYRIGSGATPKGMLPFLDRQHLDTLETERLWRCQPGAYEAAIAVLDPIDAATPDILTRHESPTTPPNYFLRNLSDQTATPLTHFPDPTPQIRGVSSQLVTYTRSDGVALSATLFLPPHYQPGTRLPLLVWAYPIEFNDAQTAGQVATSPWLFTQIRGTSHLALLTQGYAILDDATMPIIGDPETMNDTFLEQLVASAAAAIDKAVELGVADRHRVAVGGHSYGAFMTTNLLAHCDLFRAGIARSGAYNRTLTPFGFQAERRALWDAKETYFQISPFMHADKINEPLLLVHGEKDNNPGTFPLQSKRLFQAIKGNGGTARLVMLPEESHGYRARESVLHVQAETVDWLEQYVKHAQATTVWIGVTPSKKSNRPGIYRAVLDASSGQLSEPTLAAEIPGASFLAMRPDGHRLYALCQLGAPASDGVAVFGIAADRSQLSLIDTQPIDSRGAAHLSLDGAARTLFTAQYGAGTVAQFPIDPDGRIEPRAALFQHDGPRTQCSTPGGSPSTLGGHRCIRWLAISPGPGSRPSCRVSA